MTKPENNRNIPVYSIDRFNKTGHHPQYQIEVFHKNRNFQVQYPHRHDFFEILYITRGSGTHTIDLQDYTIAPNTIFFLSPGQIHSLQLSEDILGYIFLFTSEFYLWNKADKNHLLEFPFFYSLHAGSPPLLLREKEDIQIMTDLFGQAISEHKKNFHDSPEFIRALLDIILIKCKRLYPSSQDEKLNKGKLLVKKFKQLIEEKYQKNLSVKSYAELLSVTPNHLSETVKNFTGRTSTDLINDKMVLEIKRLLLHTELTVSEIGFKLNFADQSYFSRYFKKQTGLSPGEFRRNNLAS